MVFDDELVLQILSLDTLTAAPAQAPVQLVVMLLAVGLVVKNIELSRREGLRTCSTDKTCLVVLAR